MQNVNTAPTVTVRAYPAPGAKHRWRARRPWSATPRTVAVVEEVADPEREITADDLADLRRDPLLVVSTADDRTVATMADRLAAAEAEIATLRAQLAARS